ncbi:MAG: hypothetical protein AAGK04_01780 [Planctomycetota bacterium]
MRASLVTRAVVVAVVAAASSAAADLIAVTWQGGELWRLDESTGGSVRVGELGSDYRANAMARSPAGRYYVAAELDGLDDEWLFEIDPDTGASTPLFQTGIDDIRSMAFTSDGTLHAVQEGGVANSSLWTIDLVAESSQQGPTLFGVGATPSKQGLTVDDNGVAYMDGTNSSLQRVNLQSGGVTRVGVITPNVGAQSLAFDERVGLIGLGRNSGEDFSTLWSYDRSTGEADVLATFDRRDYRGFEYVPTPASVLAIGLGLCAGLGAGARRRRR